MGMTNEQFNAYRAQRLHSLERVKEEIEEKGKSPMLDMLIDDLKNELKKP